MPYKEGRFWRATPKYKGVRGKTKRCKTKKEAGEWERSERKQLKETASRRQKGTDLLTMTGRYLDHAERFLISKTYGEKKTVCRRILKAWGKDCIIDAITPAMAETYLIDQRKNRTANAVNKDRKNLNAMFNHAVKIYGVSTNPFAHTGAFPVDPGVQYTPPVEDVLRLLAVATRTERVFLDAYLQTGARRSEIFRWTWQDDVNFERREVRIGTRKTRDHSMKYRWLDMSDELHESLRWLYQNRIFKRSPYVFLCDTRCRYYGQPYQHRQRFLKTLCKRAGIEPFGYHALRRFVASLLDDQKVPLERIRRILGHEKVSTTDRYIKSIRGAGSMRETMNLLSISGLSATDGGKYEF